MKTPSKDPLLTGVTLVLVWIIVIACTFTRRPAGSPSQPTSAPTVPAAVQPGPTTPVPAATGPSADNTPTQTSAAQDEMLQPDPLDHLLGMRSVQFNLTVTRLDGAIRSLDAEIDAAGNMHLIFGYQGFDLTGMPKDYDAKALPPSAEIFVIGGKAYLNDDQDPNWKTTPFDETYPATLSLELHGLEGPSLWLNLLPPGSIQPAGNESVGGFAADKYTVDGSVDGQKISGTLWEEPQSDALVQAELHIPAALLSPPNQPKTGEMLITLKAQKKDVAPVALPGG